MSTDQGRISLVLLPEGDRGQRLLSIACEWAGLGLLQRSLWFVVEDVLDESQEIVATLAQEGGALPRQPPFGLLSRMRLDAIQLLVLQTPSPDAPSSQRQVRAAEGLKRLLEASLPQATERAAGKQVIGSTWINAVAAPSGLAGVNYESVAIRGFTTLVASPEDRRSPTQIDGYVDEGDPHLAWSLAQAASLLGLWRGIDERPLAEFMDRFEGVKKAKEWSEQVIPFRAFTRLVTSAPITRAQVSRAMTEIMDGAANEVLPKTAVAYDPDPGQRASTFAEAMQGYVLESAFVGEYEPGPPPVRVKISVSGLVKDFWGFSGKEIKALPREWSWRIRSRFRKVVQGAAEGKGEGEGIYEVVLKDNPPQDDFFQAEFESRTAANRGRLGDYAPLAANSSAPRTWQRLRGGIFSILDGSPMPEGMESVERKTERGRPLVFRTTERAVPRPVPWSVEFSEPRQFEDIALQDQRVYAGDPAEADRIADYFDGSIHALAARRTSTEHDLQDVEQRIQEIDSQLEQLETRRTLLEEQLTLRWEAESVASVAPPGTGGSHGAD